MTVPLSSVSHPSWFTKYSRLESYFPRMCNTYIHACWQWQHHCSAKPLWNSGALSIRIPFLISGWTIGYDRVGCQWCKEVCGEETQKTHKLLNQRSVLSLLHSRCLNLGGMWTREWSWWGWTRLAKWPLLWIGAGVVCFLPVQTLSITFKSTSGLRGPHLKWLWKM